MENDKEYYCRVCNYGTDDASNFIKHKKRKRHKDNIKANKVIEDEENLKKFSCPHCGVRYTRKDALKRHEDKCSQRYINLLRKELQAQLTINSVQKEKLDKYKSDINEYKDLMSNAIRELNQANKDKDHLEEFIEKNKRFMFKGEHGVPEIVYYPLLHDKAYYE